MRPTLLFLIVVGGQDFLPPLQQLPPPPHQCGGLGRRRKMWLYTCLQKCRRGKGGVQPRKLAAGNGFFSGSRKGTDTASNWSRGILHTGQLRLQRPGPDLRKGWKTSIFSTLVREEVQTQGQEEVGRQERLCSIAIKPKLLCIHSYYSRLCQVFPL